MKKLAVLIIVISFCLFNYGFAQSTSEQSFIPVSVIQKEGEAKTFYELGAKYDYELFNRNGKKLSYGNSHSIEITNLEPGVYFLRYNKMTEKLVIK